MEKKERLFSLDLLRGLDMFLLTVVGPLFWAIHGLMKFPDAVTRQFKHPWGGFTLWDIIMPLFIFMCGAAIPYALSKRMEGGRPTADYWRHVVLRVAFLWFCGLLVQGDLATLDPARIYPYSNTLQSIAAGYLIAAMAFAVPVRAVRVFAPVALAAAYGLLLHFLGDYTTTGNFAFAVEKKVLTALLPASSDIARGIAGLTAETAAGTSKFHYTWWLTTLMFGAMTLCGAQCAEILRGAWEPRRKALVLFLLGAVLLAGGWALVPVVPPIKHIYSVSFTCQAMGWSILLLALLYTATDIAKIRRGMWIFTLFGQCALTCYMVTHFFGAALQKAAAVLVQGVPHLLAGFGVQDESLQGSLHRLATTLAAAVLLTFVLWVRRRLSAARPDEATVTAEPAAERTPRAATDNGAVAERYRLPGQVEPPPAPRTAESDESGTTGPKMASKVRLQLHRKPEAPAPEPAPALPNAGVIRLKPPNGQKPVPYQPEPPTVELKPRTP